MMDSEFFGLRTLPFEDRADTQFIYPTAENQAALAALVYEIQHGIGLGLLIGEAGTGKTLLLRTLLRRFEKSHQTVEIIWPTNGAMDLLRECCKRFGVAPPFSHNESHTLNRLRRHLSRCACAGIRSILMIDQAQNLSPGNIDQLAMLAELCGERGRFLNVFLAAQSSVRALLDRPEFAWIGLRRLGEHTLSPFTPKETGEYIRHRLRIAGAVNTRLFDDRAIALIHKVSEGVPRLINRVCNASMLVAYGAQTPCISIKIVEAASDQGGSSLTSRPAVRERTIAVRDLGPAMIGEGGAPWLGNPETPVQVASSGEVPLIPSLIASSVTPAEIPNDEGADGTKETSGASIVDGEYEGFNNEILATGPHKGTFLLARLEQAMARAERMTGTINALLTRLAVVEQRLASLADQAQRQNSCLERTLSEGVRTPALLCR